LLQSRRHDDLNKKFNYSTVDSISIEVYRVLLALSPSLKMAKVAIEDLSGHTTPVTGNPYDGLISATNDDSVGPNNYHTFKSLLRHLSRSSYKNDMTSIEELVTASKRPKS
jgi:hypothetical protein